MTLYRIDASIRQTGSASRELADVVEQHWRAEHPTDAVVRRDLGADPLPADAWAASVSAGFTPEDDRTPQQVAALAFARELVDELLAADEVLLTAPLYNFGLSQHLKTWVDLVISDPRAGAGAPPLLPGKKVVMVAVRGGSYAPGTPRDGWDHGTDYMRRILVDVWGADLTVVERGFTLVGVKPGLEQFTEVAGALHREATEAARDAGRALVGRATEQPAA